MSRSSSDAKIRHLQRELEAEKLAHTRTRNELQQEIRRWQWLTRPKLLELLATYPGLQKLLDTLAEAAGLQDPLRGAPSEDTMRTETTELTPTERAVLSHRKHRSNVRLLDTDIQYLQRKINELVDHQAHTMAQLIGGQERLFELPDRPVCHRKGCTARGRQQPYTAWTEGCTGCGRRFDGQATLAAQSPSNH